MAGSLIQVMQLISSLEVGGSEKLLLDLLNAQSDFEFVQYTVVVMNQAVNLDMRSRLEKTGCNVYFLERPEGQLHFKYLRRLLKIVEQHQVGIIHSHNRGSMCWAVLCKIFRPALKLVFTVHDTVPTRFDFFQRFLHRLFIDHHIAISKSVAQLCQREGFYPHTQIYNGIDVEAYKNINRPSGLRRVQENPYVQKPLRIVQVGRLYYPKKGQDLLIRAVAQCQQVGMSVKATLMGSVHPYSEHSYKVLKDLVMQLGVQHDIEFIVNQTDVSSVLRDADLFILPSRYEGLGLVVLEAMAAGVPVIASNIDGPAELIHSGENGLLFECDDCSSLFEAIHFIYDNPEKADFYARNALEFVKLFDIKAMRQRYELLYHQLTAPANVKLLLFDESTSYSDREAYHGTSV